MQQNPHPTLSKDVPHRNFSSDSVWRPEFFKDVDTTSRLDIHWAHCCCVYSALCECLERLTRRYCWSGNGREWVCNPRETRVCMCIRNNSAAEENMMLISPPRKNVQSLSLADAVCFGLMKNSYSFSTSSSSKFKTTPRPSRPPPYFFLHATSCAHLFARHWRKKVSRELRLERSHSVFLSISLSTSLREKERNKKEIRKRVAQSFGETRVCVSMSSFCFHFSTCFFFFFNLPFLELKVWPPSCVLWWRKFSLLT